MPLSHEMDQMLFYHTVMIQRMRTEWQTAVCTLIRLGLQCLPRPVCQNRYSSYKRRALRSGYNMGICPPLSKFTITIVGIK